MEKGLPHRYICPVISIYYPRKIHCMKHRILAFFFPSKYPLVASAASSAKFTTVSLHGLVNQLLSGLQPVALRRDNIILNGIPNGLSVLTDVNMLANGLRNLIGSAVNSKKNECIHVIVTTAADRIMICIEGAGTYEVRGANNSMVISNSRLAA